MKPLSLNQRCSGLSATADALASHESRPRGRRSNDFGSQRMKVILQNTRTKRPLNDGYPVRLCALPRRNDPVTFGGRSYIVDRVLHDGIHLPKVMLSRVMGAGWSVPC